MHNKVFNHRSAFGCAGQPIASPGYDWERAFSGSAFQSNLQNVFILIFTGVFIAGGSKASLKLFRDVFRIKSYAEDQRDKKTLSIPKDPSTAAIDAANGNTDSRKALENLFNSSKIKKTSDS